MLEPPTQLTIVQQRMLGGVARLLGRDAVIRVMSLLGGIVIARALQPSVFGLFAVASFAVALVGTLSELGLGAAFIRKPGQVSSHELDALFTFQLISVAALAMALFAAAPAVAWLYHSTALVWVVRALCLSLIVSSLRSVPIVILERRLDYGPVALSAMGGQLTYWTVAVLGALAGFGVWSIVAGVIVSAIAATALLYIKSGWRPSLEFDWRPIRQRAPFGIMYQSQAVTHFAKDTLAPSLGGIVYGSAAVGYLSWALQLAVLPMQLAQLAAQVSYPALARLQEDRAAFLALLSSSLRWTARLSFPAFAVLAGLAPQIIAYVYGPKWFPALNALYFLYLNTALGVGTGLLMAALYSAGRASVGLRISVGWTLATWVLAIGLVAAHLGFTAIPIALLVGTMGALVVIVRETRRLGSIDLVRPVALPAVSGLTLFLGLRAAGPWLVHDLVTLGIACVAAGAGGLLVNLWADRSIVLASLRSLRGGVPAVGVEAI